MSINESLSLVGEITVPGDKSISHRAIMIGALAKGKSIAENFLMGDDCLSTIQAFRSMGVEININKTKVEINGVGLHGLKRPNNHIDVGNSGTTIRLISGILAGQKFDSTITGDDSIKKRPMDRVIVPLREMGADISGREDKLAPLSIKAIDRLRGIKYSLPISSAQVKSCILLAALYAKGPTEIIQPSFSRDHTERMLKLFGSDIRMDGKRIVLNPNRDLIPQKIVVPGDISSAAFFIVGALIIKGSEIVIRNVGLNPTRTGILDVLISMGGNIEIINRKNISSEPVGDIIVKHSPLKGTIIEGDIIPKLIDEIPILALAASLAQGRTIIRDAGELKAKESNRLTAISTELKKMGAKIEEQDDGLIIEGGSSLIASPHVETYKDHRIAMTLAIASLLVGGDTSLNERESINVSFPGFFKVLESLCDK